MGDFLNRLGGQQLSAGTGTAQRQFLQVHFAGPGIFAPGVHRQLVNRIRTRRHQFQAAVFRAEPVNPVGDEFFDKTALAVSLARTVVAVDDAELDFRVEFAEFIKPAAVNLIGDIDDFVIALALDAQQFVIFVAEHGVVALDVGADITVFTVPTDLDVVQSHIAAVDLAESADQFGAARKMLAVFIQQRLQIGDGVIGERFQMFADFLDPLVDVGDFLFVFLDVEQRNTADRDRQQHGDVVLAHVAHQLVAELHHAVINRLADLFERFALFDVFVDTVLNKNLRQRFPVRFFIAAGKLVFQFAFQVVQQFFGIAPDHGLHVHDLGFVLADHQHVDRFGDRTVGVGVQRLHGFFRVLPARRNDFDFDVFAGVIVDCGDFQAVFLDLPFDGRDQLLGGGQRRDFADDQLAAVDVDAGTQLDFAVALLVFGHIHQPALLEIRVKLVFLAVQFGDLRFEQFDKVMRHDFGGHADRDPLRTQQQQRRDLDRQHHRLFFAPVVGFDEIGQVFVEQHLAPQRRQPRFDITRRRRAVTGQDVAEVPLPVHEIFFVRQHHQRVADRGVAVGMILHGLPDDVGDFVEFAVVGGVHRPENAALDRLQPVVHVRNGPFLDHIRGVFQIILVHHPADQAVGAFAGLGIGVGFAVHQFGRVDHQIFAVVDIVGHQASSMISRLVII